MRAERRREIERQMSGEKPVQKKKRNGFFTFIALLYLLSGAICFFLIWRLGIVPEKYFYLALGALCVITLFTAPVLISKRGRKGRKIGATFFSILMIAAFGFGSYYMMETSSFLRDITRKDVPTVDYHVVVLYDNMPEVFFESDSSKDDRDEAALRSIANQTLGTFMSHDVMYSEAKAMLQNLTPVSFGYDDDVKTSMNRLLNGEHGAIFIPVASYEAIKAEDEYRNIDSDTQIIYTVKVPRQTIDRTKAINVTSETFNVFISGTDLEGYRSDVNMIATVNPITHEVLLTSIPRDLYVTLPSYDAKDKLTHTRIYGIEESVGAVEDVFGVDINYYLKVNYSALKGIVDAIGGIDVESKYDFYTSGMGSLNGTHFTVGVNHMDGKQALAFSRERKSFDAGDMTRNENQQAVLEAILNKATSSATILTSYSKILDAVSGNIETNMSPEEMSELVRMQLDDMHRWKIDKRSVKGENANDMCYSLGLYAAVVKPIPEEIAMAQDEIIRVMVGE